MTMRHVSLPSGIVVLSVAFLACSPPVDPEELMAADRAFSEAVSTGGSAAWVSWFAEDGAMIQQGMGEIRGHAAITSAVGYLDDPLVSLTWEPARAEIARSGDLGWTTGTYVFHSGDSLGTQNRSEGLYVSIWRRQSDGTWKVVMDLGNPT